ncbi:MAG: hypothetical protein IH851_00520 [Armatimonadetes bacterium]|nr:hypothetical protein [Armatimonadota bacterium]
MSRGQIVGVIIAGVILLSVGFGLVVDRILVPRMMEDAIRSGEDAMAQSRRVREIRDEHIERIRASQNLDGEARAYIEESIKSDDGFVRHAAFRLLEVVLEVDRGEKAYVVACMEEIISREPEDTGQYRNKERLIEKLENVKSG